MIYSHLFNTLSNKKLWSSGSCEKGETYGMASICHQAISYLTKKSVKSSCGSISVDIIKIETLRKQCEQIDIFLQYLAI